MKVNRRLFPSLCLAVTAACLSLMASEGLAKAPSFDCSTAFTEINKTICEDPELSALDRKLAHVYSQASRRYPTTAPLQLRAEHPAWEKKLNECSTDSNKRECIRNSYMSRIAEVQARNDLVSSKTERFRCVTESGTENPLIATFHQTDPPTATLQRADQRVVAFMNQSANDSIYEGTSVTFRHEADHARVEWLADVLSCSLN
jgi:uncharacterized protein